MSESLVIEARGLSKRFKLYDRPRDRFVEWITFGKRTMHDSFWALRDVDVTLKQGEKLGIIGANGSGKSTLLKILAGSLTPTSGECTITGRAFALLELSTGFNKDLTGRENIAFVGLMLGLDRAYVEGRREQIIAFADIGDFIDRPVRFYSSGMFVRLAFSMFAFLEPDLLMIDEAFAVGDAEFKEKSYKLMQSMVRTDGRSVIFVSHSMTTIEGVCDRVMWMEHGVCRMVGDPKEVIEAYRDHVRERKQERLAREAAEQGGVDSNVAADDSAQREVKLPTIKVPAAPLRLHFDGERANRAGVGFDAVWLEEKDGTPVERIGAHRKFAIACSVTFAREAQPAFGIRIIGADGAALTMGDTTHEGTHVAPAHEGEARAIRWPIARGLPPGEYDVVCWCAASESAGVEERAEARVRVIVDGPPRVDAVMNLVMRPMMGRAVHDR